MSMRTEYCGLVTEALVGQTVSLCGWVHRRRDHGGVIFIDLRDREGLVQVVCNPDQAEVFSVAESVRNEYCLRITGTVKDRLAGTVNNNLKSGKIEVVAAKVEVLNASVPVPFQLDDDNLSETTRLTHRVLDLRRPQMQNNLRLRYKVSMEVRKYLDDLGFIDIETPVLTKSTPEGARDYLVPSRVNAHEFFALPQSPQLFKQLLMVANFDRYYQITKCFRDEDLRADRQPEFTQIDCETSFLTEQEIRDLFETMIRKVFKNTMDVDLPNPFPVMDFAEAMGKYGSDKPDMRVKLEFTELTDVMKNVEFKVFSGAANMNNGRVVGMRVPKGADMPRCLMPSMRNGAPIPAISLPASNICASRTSMPKRPSFWRRCPRSATSSSMPANGGTSSASSAAASSTRASSAPPTRSSPIASRPAPPISSRPSSMPAGMRCAGCRTPMPPKRTSARSFRSPAVRFRSRARGTGSAARRKPAVLASPPNSTARRRASRAPSTASSLANAWAARR